MGGLVRSENDTLTGLIDTSEGEGSRDIGRNTFIGDDNTIKWIDLRD